MNAEYLEQMRAWIESGSALSNSSAIQLLKEVDRLRKAQNAGDRTEGSTAQPVA